MDMYDYHSVKNDLHFVSFGGGGLRYRRALSRLQTEIRKLAPTAKVWLFDDEIAIEAIEGLGCDLGTFAERHPKGYGLWVWKPWIINRVLDQVEDGSTVFYLDSGCTVHLSADSRKRFDSYRDHLLQVKFLFFQQKHAEISWTKKEVLTLFALDDHQLLSGQAIGGIQGYLVNQETRHFVRSWLDYCTRESGRYLLDVELRHLESDRFKDHRHDQSVLSCLIKSKGISMLEDETFFYPYWNRDGASFPFWATRKCSGIPSWMGYYAPRAWPWVALSRLRGKPLTPLLETN